MQVGKTLSWERVARRRRDGCGAVQSPAWYRPSSAAAAAPSPRGRQGFMHPAGKCKIFLTQIVLGVQKQNPQPCGCGPCNKKRGEENEKDEEIIFDLPLLYQSNVKKKSG